MSKWHGANDDALRDVLPKVRGRITWHAELGENSWFRAGGAAQVLFKPKDQDDLCSFLGQLSQDIPVTVLGVASNLIIRDGGIPGVVIRLGRDWARVDCDRGSYQVKAGSAALDANVARAAVGAGIGGLEFLSGIPGTIGGALRMNAGAYDKETRDILITAKMVTRTGDEVSLSADEMGMSYRHVEVPTSLIFTSALLQGVEQDTATGLSKIEDIKARRAKTQPVKARTGGSTFTNPSADDLADASLPSETKVWQLIDKVGGRGLRVGGAMMSEKHCNFMINDAEATSQDLEDLGEEIRRRVKQEFGIVLRWEIRRIGIAHPQTDNHV